MHSPTRLIPAGPFRFRSACAAALILASTVTIHAATRTWDGGGTVSFGATSFLQAANWDGNTALAAGSAVKIGTSFTSGRHATVFGSVDLESIHLTGVASNFKITGKSGFGVVPKLILRSGDITCEADGCAIETPIELRSPGEWFVGAWRTLTLGGPISFSGRLGWFSAMVKSGGGTLELTGTNTYPMITWVSAGSLRVLASGALSAGQPVLVRPIDNPSMPPRLDLGPSVVVTPSYVNVMDAEITGPISSGIQSPQVDLLDGATLEVALYGTSAVTVYSGAEAALLAGHSTFSGTITLQDGSVLQIGTTACLGANGNTVIVQGEASLTSYLSTALSAGKTLQIPAGSQINLEDFRSIGATFSGAGTAALFTPSGHAATLTSANPAFTGIFDRNDGDLVAGATGSLGNAFQISLNGTGDLILAAANPASSQPVVIPGNLHGIRVSHNGLVETLGELKLVGATSASHITFEPAITSASLTFTAITFPASAAGTVNLRIRGWKGTPNGSSSAATKVFGPPGLSAANLSRIRIEQTIGTTTYTYPVRQLSSGEIIPQP